MKYEKALKSAPFFSADNSYLREKQVAMETVQKCPYCKSEYSGQVDKCPKCGYPITGTKEEQGVFVGRRIMMKGDIDESATSIKRARVVLIILACLYAFITVRFALMFNEMDFYELMAVCSASIVITVLFLVCIILLKNHSVLSLWMSLILYVLLSLNSIIHLRGIVLIGIVIGILINSLVDVKKAEKAKKELNIN